jgi:hypothetical protein
VTAAGWTREELDRIGSAEQLMIAPVRGDGALGRMLPIWVVRVGDELYVRSWRGTRGAWFRAVRASHAGRISAGGVETDVELLDAQQRPDDAIDGAYRDKYSRYPAHVEPMVSPQARATTLRLIPRRGEQDAA